MSLQLSKNATCVLTDADIYSRTQNAKMALNLYSNLPGSNIEGDRIMVITSANEPVMRPYSAGGEGGKIYGGVDGVVVDNDNNTVGLNEEVWGILDSYTETSGNFLTSADIADFATETYVNNEIASATQDFITSADIPEIPVIGFENNGVLDTDYEGIKITNDSVGNEHVNLKKGESWYNHGLLVPTSPGNDKYLTTTSAGHLSWENQPTIPSLDGYATETWVQNQGYITSVPSEYVTDTELSATSAAIENEIPGVRDLVAGNGINITSTNSDVTISVDGSVVTSSELSTVSADIVSQIPSLQGYATEGYVQDYTSAFITSADIPKEVPDPDVYQFLTSDGTSAMVWRNLRTVNNKLKEGQYIHLEERAFYEGYKETTISVSGLQPEGNYLTSGDLNGYATEAWVQNQDYITSADVPPQVQSDWSEVDSAAIDYIKNKPEMSELSAISPLYINDTQNGSEIGIDASAFPDTSDMATQTWCSSSFFPIDGLQVVNSSAEASGANIVYLIPISNS